MNMHIIRIIKSLHTRDYLDHRTELLEAFTNADAVTEDASKGQTNQEGKAKQEVCDT